MDNNEIDWSTMSSEDIEKYEEDNKLMKMVYKGLTYLPETLFKSFHHVFRI